MPSEQWVSTHLKKTRTGRKHNVHGTGYVVIISINTEIQHF